MALDPSTCPPPAPLPQATACNGAMPVFVCNAADITGGGGNGTPPATTPITLAGHDCNNTLVNANGLSGQLVQIVQPVGQVLNAALCPNPQLTNIEASLSNAVTQLQAINGNTDTVEALQASTTAAATATTAAVTALTQYVDTVEALLGTLGTNTDQVEALLNTLGVQTDQVEPLLVSANATLTDVKASLAQVAGVDCNGVASAQLGIPVILRAVGTVKLCVETLDALLLAISKQAAVEVEAGCVNGVSWSRITRVAFNVPNLDLANNIVLYRDSIGNEQPTMPVGFKLGACSVPVYGWAGGVIAGGLISANNPNFTGAVDTFNTTSLGATPDLQSITVTARNVQDGDNSTDKVTVLTPDGRQFTMFDGQSVTFSVARDNDSSLALNYVVIAKGNAYANIFGTAVTPSII